MGSTARSLRVRARVTPHRARAKACCLSIHAKAFLSLSLSLSLTNERWQRSVGVFGVAASTREIDLQNLTRVPRFGESIDRQESENQTSPRF